jgi:hypothetical protein
MAKQRSSFAKLQRDRAKAAKRAEKLSNRGTSSSVPGPVIAGPLVLDDDDLMLDDRELTTVEQLFEGKGELTAPQLLQMIEDVHKMRQRGELSEDDFEDAKIEIFARLPMD